MKSNVVTGQFLTIVISHIGKYVWFCHIMHHYIKYESITETEMQFHGILM